MGRLLWKERVVSDPELHHGVPCIRGTRIPVSVIVASLADGLRPEEIINEYPQLTDLDIRAALGYAAEVLQDEMVLPLEH